MAVSRARFQLFIRNSENVFFILDSERGNDVYCRHFENILSGTNTGLKISTSHFFFYPKSLSGGTLVTYILRIRACVKYKSYKRVL